MLAFKLSDLERNGNNSSLGALGRMGLFRSKAYCKLSEMLVTYAIHRLVYHFLREKLFQRLSCAHCYQTWSYHYHNVHSYRRG